MGCYASLNWTMPSSFLLFWSIFLGEMMSPLKWDTSISYFMILVLFYFLCWCYWDRFLYSNIDSWLFICYPLLCIPWPDIMKELFMSVLIELSMLVLTYLVSSVSHPVFLRSLTYESINDLNILYLGTMLPPGPQFTWCFSADTDGDLSSSKFDARLNLFYLLLLSTSNGTTSFSSSCFTTYIGLCSCLSLSLELRSRWTTLAC